MIRYVGRTGRRLFFNPEDARFYVLEEWGAIPISLPRGLRADSATPFTRILRHGEGKWIFRRDGLDYSALGERRGFGVFTRLNNDS